MGVGNWDGFWPRPRFRWEPRHAFVDLRGAHVCSAEVSNSAAEPDGTGVTGLGICSSRRRTGLTKLVDQVDFTPTVHGALAMRAASSPPVDELEERRPLTEAARSPFAAPPSTSAWQRARDQLRRALGAERTPGNALNQDLLASISAAVRGQVSATPMAAGGGNERPAGAAGAPTTADADADATDAPPLAALPDSVPRGDILAAARWVEDAMPFAMLLLVVFLYRHLVSILTFFWLTSLLHNANERMRHAATRCERAARLSPGSPPL